jgi:hypothetical protein
MESPQPKGILKTSQSKNAKRKLVQEGLLRQVTGGSASTSPITFKVLVFGSQGCGKSTLCRALSGGSPLVQNVDGRGASMGSDSSTIGIETTSVLIASFRGRPVYLHLWEIPYELILAASSNNKSRLNANAAATSGLSSHSQLDAAFFGAHGGILVLDSRDTTMESVRAIDEARDVIQCMLKGTSRVFSNDIDYLQRMMNLLGTPPPTGIGSNAMEDPEKACRFPLYLLAHKADHPAAAVAASGEFGKDEHSPGLHFADSQFERLHGGQSRNGYPPSWYTRHPRHNAEPGISSFKYALGMSPDEIGNYARRAGFRGWWWTSSLPTLLGADQIGAATVKKKNTSTILTSLPRKLKGISIDSNNALNVRKDTASQLIAAPTSLDKDEKQGAGRSFFSGLFSFGNPGDAISMNNSKGAQGISSLTQSIPQLLENISASYVSATSDGSNGGDKSDATAPLTSLQVVFANIVDDCLEFYEYLSSTDEVVMPQESTANEGCIYF